MNEILILLEGKNCYLRILTEEDATLFTKLLTANKEYWSIFEPRHEQVFLPLQFKERKLGNRFIR